jgi:RNA polymerase sigma-70 factor (ECF subfamily)
VADERELIARAQRGDTAAFEVLVQMHAQFVYNLALRVVRDPQEAEDLAQEALLRAWRGLPRFRAQARFSTWLYRIVTNLCYNRLPRLKQELAAEDPDEAALHLPDKRQRVEGQIVSKELREKLHAAIDQLPDAYRLLITLRHLQGMAYTEIAQATGMPLGTVKTGIFRARRILRKELEEYDTRIE